jgi:hypothetical protein
MYLRHIGVLTVLGMSAGAVRAQEVPEMPGVAEAVANEFEPIGAHVGSAYIYPEATASFTATDNVLAAPSPRREDVYLTARPAVRVVAQPGINRFTLYSYVSQSVHANISDENITEFGARGFARLGERQRSNFYATISADRLSDDRENTNNIIAARTPIHRGRFSGEAGYHHVVNRLTLDGAVNILRTDYANGRTRAGTIIDQQYRDYTSVGIAGEARYALQDNFSVIARVSADRLNYDFGAGDAGFDLLINSDRDSRRYRAELGVAYRDGQNVSADFTAGYLTRRYGDQPVRLKNPSGLSFKANATWNYDPKATFKFSADRDFLESAQPLINGLRATTAVFTAEYSPIRPLLLSVGGAVQRIEPNGPGRNRTEFSTSIGAKYYLSRRYSVFASLTSGGRNSNDPVIEYRKLTFVTGIKATF